MRMKKLAVVIVMMAFVSVQSAIAQKDADGSRDHPLLTRMPGYYIDSYRVDEFAGFDPTVIGGKEVH